MAHFNSHEEPRRAKNLDLAKKTVKGSLPKYCRRGSRRAKQTEQQWRRRAEGQTYRHLRDFYCSGGVECECPGCSCELWTARDLRASTWDGGACPLDDLRGAKRSAQKWAYRLGSSDAFLSWLKRTYPDTVAGRHAIDHIMDDLKWLVCCVCNVDFSGKGNHGQCTCGAFLIDWAKVFGKNLAGTFFDGACLQRVLLARADFTGAHLCDTDLSGAVLTGAHLCGADLTGADLYGADLTGADLTGAHLYGADLTGADLTGANLEGAEANRYTRWSKGFDPEAAGVTCKASD